MDVNDGHASKLRDPNAPEEPQSATSLTGLHVRDNAKHLAEHVTKGAGQALNLTMTKGREALEGASKLGQEVGVRVSTEMREIKEIQTLAENDEDGACDTILCLAVACAGKGRVGGWGGSGPGSAQLGGPTVGVALFARCCRECHCSPHCVLLLLLSSQKAGSNDLAAPSSAGAQPPLLALTLTPSHRSHRGPLPIALPDTTSSQ